jgi:type I restriction enzyme S subunit
MTVQGEIRPGYKQTEVGVIPEDWDQLVIDNLVDTGALEKPMDGNHGAIHPKSADFVGYGIPFVMANNLIGGRLNIDSCAHITRKQADGLQKGFAQAGDILLTHKATIGETAIVGEILFDYLMLTPQVTYYRVKNAEVIDRDYLFHFFNGKVFQDQLQLMSGGGTRSYIGITAQRKLPVVLPNAVEEQRAIAAALSDADALIAALEGMIAKKRDLKQAAMQHLLTGKTRLPGFSGEWEVKRLGDVCRISTGKKDVNEGNPNGHYPFFTCARDHTFSDGFSFEGEAILIAGNGDVGNLSYFNGRFEAYQRTYVLQGFTSNVTYLWHQLSAFLVISLGVGTIGSSIPYIKKENLLKFEFQAPSNPSEQTAIAEVLSDMDAHLAALEAQAAKARAVKQGMMQELLTGRVRLV